MNLLVLGFVGILFYLIFVAGIITLLWQWIAKIRISFFHVFVIGIIGASIIFAITIASRRCPSREVGIGLGAGISIVYLGLLTWKRRRKAS